MDLDVLEGHLNFDWNVNRQHSVQSELKNAAFATMYNRYPSENWLHVYTDGSVKNAVKNSGAGAYSNIFNINCHVGKYYDNFDAEIAAIIYGIDDLRNSCDHNIIFFIDS
ncbi:hypothetical protein TNCV_697551 [Trichonephila clavipes]|nr:hypothetical protein TNCV_697551 [Trichonephila clavipes]